MTLNLITCLFRGGMLQKINDTVPNHPDINWIIVICEERAILRKEAEDLRLPFVTMRWKDIPANTHLKWNKGVKMSKPGFIQALDDDTTFNEGSYRAFHQYKNTHKLIVGDQAFKDGGKRLAQVPACCYTDGGQALIHTDLAKQVELGDFVADPAADGRYLEKLWALAKPEERIIVQETISNYNFLR